MQLSISIQQQLAESYYKFARTNTMYLRVRCHRDDPAFLNCWRVCSRSNWQDTCQFIILKQVPLYCVHYLIVAAAITHQSWTSSSYTSIINSSCRYVGARVIMLEWFSATQHTGLWADVYSKTNCRLDIKTHITASSIVFWILKRTKSYSRLGRNLNNVISQIIPLRSAKMLRNPVWLFIRTSH